MYAFTDLMRWVEEEIFWVCMPSEHSLIAITVAQMKLIGALCWYGHNSILDNHILCVLIHE
jgi:hypothetical protein